MWLAALIVLVFLPTVQAKPRYFLTATLVSIDNRAGEAWYVFNGPFGNLTARRKQTRHQPRVSKGEVRISVEEGAAAGDVFYFLDWDDRTFKAVLVERTHPPPPVVF